MRIPMHRFKYTKLTPEQIGTKLKAADGGPKSASAFSTALNGKMLKIVTRDGPTLEYRFGANRRLTLAENGGRPVSAGYGELTLNQIVFFSHLIPGAQKGYNVFIDQKTGLATVFEVWLSSGIKLNAGRPGEFTLDDREVQRQIYFGYVDTGQKAPEKLHHYTNRMTGKGLHWKQDTGIETLELYASVANTNFVELTRHIDDLGYVAPSDYVLVDDRTILYNRTECEFSGIHTCFVADLYGLKQVGVRFGFNEKDELEYYLFRGDGRIVGQLAYLENFDDYGAVPMFAAQAPAAAKPAKGARVTYRPVRTFTHMTDEQVQAAAETRTSAFGSGAAQQAPPQALGTGNNLPFSAILVGKEFTLRFDNGGPVRDYRISDPFKLQYRDQKDNLWHEADYRAYEGDDNLAWFSHFIADSKPRACVMVAVDFTNGLTTSIESHMGTAYYGNETTYRPIFGVVEMPGLEAPLYVRHELTDELVGNAFSWSYSDQVTSMHLYTSPHSMSWVIFTGAQQLGAEWCSPCIFVKLRPGVYIFCQNEEACNGNQMTELLNTKNSHDCGFTFNGGARGVSLGTTGAIGRHIGKFELLEFYGPKRRSA
ncbi:MAG TPA: MoaF N-terminal domain-containing protein [Steroidobacteraceae bacterium]|nr:MoaF N-terminal domain-containing protein [Steroidobacteraceae bacterium]